VHTTVHCALHAIGNFVSIKLFKFKNITHLHATLHNISANKSKALKLHLTAYGACHKNIQTRERDRQKKKEEVRVARLAKELLHAATRRALVRSTTWVRLPINSLHFTARLVSRLLVSFAYNRERAPREESREERLWRVCVVIDKEEATFLFIYLYTQTSIRASVYLAFR
jgi:hypothetical protein